MSYFKTAPKSLNTSWIICLAVIFFAAINWAYKPDVSPPTSASPLAKKYEKGLKDYYKKYFSIGVAVNIAALSGDEADLISREFNSVTAENDMKMGPIHPRENTYNWRNADSIVNFAIKHNIRVRGHNLLWHAQAPAWMFKDSTGKQVSKEVLLQRLKDHITTVVNHFKGRIYAWDVVNEAIDDKPDSYLRNSLWYKICGEDFIPKAFEYAMQPTHPLRFTITTTTAKKNLKGRRFTGC
jgi:endo-1,4-beta-xylanase